MIRKLLVSAIQLYRTALSPFLPPACRFHPSCSEYSLQSLEKFGLAKGIRLSASRLMKCHPFHPGGYDPVP